MHTAVVLLLMVFCAASAHATLAEEGIIARPQGRPPTEAESPEVPPYPEYAPPRPAGAEYDEQDYFWLNDIDGKQQWEDPSLVLTAEDGSESYIDPATGEPTDVKPVEAAWLSMWDEEYDHEFFYNEQTNETTWTVPYYFAWHQVWVDEDGRVASPHEEEDSFEIDVNIGGEEAKELSGEEPPDWDPSGSSDGDGPWEEEEDPADPAFWVDEGAEAEQQPSEEELAEEEVLRREEGGGTGEL